MSIPRPAVPLFIASICALACGRTAAVSVPAPHAAPVRLDVAETDEAGKVFPGGSFPYTFADINSQLRITPRIDSGTATTVYGRAAASDSTSALLVALSDSLAALRAVITGLDSVPAITRRISDAIARGDRAADRAAVALHGRLVAGAVNYLAVVAPALGDSLLSQPTTDYAAVGAFLSGRAEDLTQRAQDVGRAVRERALREGLSVQVWAMLYSPGRAPAQVHVEGYDHLPSGDPNPVPKLGFSQTPADQADLDRATHEYRQLVDAIDSLRRALPAMAQEAATLLGSARAALEQGQRAVKRLPRLKALHDSLQVLAADTHLRAVADSLRSLATQFLSLEALRDILDTAVRRFQLQPSPAVGFQAFVDAARQIGLALGHLGDTLTALTARIPTDLSGRVRLLAQLADDAGVAVAGPARESVTALAAHMREDWVPAIDSIVAVRDRYRHFRRNAEQLVSLVDRTLPLFRSIAASQVAPEPTELLAIPAADARPGGLDLTRIGPRDGDRIVATLRVLGGDPQRALLDVEQTVRVRTYGWHRRWQAGLAFTRESRADGVLPGVSLSWMVHYRTRPARGAAEPPRDGAPLLGFLDVGAGLTSIAITRGSDVQLGFGPTLSLFGDAIVLGGGFNFERQKGFLLFSTPLLDLVRSVRGTAHVDGPRAASPGRP